jgi:RNA polymerase subunit RPABC4/transcription elongation factor Spt4
MTKWRCKSCGELVDEGRYCPNASDLRHIPVHAGWEPVEEKRKPT